MNKWIGIDGGLNGAIAVIDEENNEVKVFDTPTYTEKLKNSTKNRYDLKGIYKILYTYMEESYAVFEKGQAMPGQGSVSMVSIGYCNGIFNAYLTCLQIPYEQIHPKRWQREFSIKGDTKVQSVEIAEKLFPKIEFRTERGRLLSGRSDAMLMAEYGRRKMRGQLNVK